MPAGGDSHRVPGVTVTRTENVSTAEESHMRDAVIVEAGRTPIGRRGGARGGTRGGAACGWGRRGGEQDPGPAGLGLRAVAPRAARAVPARPPGTRRRDAGA